jgi:hypothetical protein
MRRSANGGPPVRILAGETYLDLEAARHVVVVECVIDRTGSALRRTDRYRVVAADGPERGRMWIVHASALAPCLTNAPLQPKGRGGPPRPIATVLAAALARVGAAALPLCQTEEERAIASALARCATNGGDALRELARALLATSTSKEDERSTP